MPRKIKVDGQIMIVPDDATDEEINQLAGPAPASAAPVSAPVAPKPATPGNVLTSGHPLDTLKANIAKVQQGAQPGDGLMMGALKNFGAGGADVVHSLGHAIAHPIDTISSAAHDMEAEHEKPIGTQLKDMVTSGKVLGFGGESLVGAAKGLVSNPARTLGQIGTGAVIGDVAAPLLAGAGGAVRSAAIGDTDAAALRGLRVPPSGKKVLPMQDAVRTARPFLQGADSLEDLQGKVKPAKNEIYKPIADTLAAEGDNPVMGPDGPTTLRELEAERKQLSAMNRGLKTGDPAALQLAQQKGLSQADALAREEAVKSALDPEFAKYGIDPKAIRQAYSAVSRVGNQVAGRSTLLEKPQPFGLGKMSNFDITKPLKDIGNLGSGLRDLVAGRPMFSGSPTDIGVREGFAKSGPKPDFGQYTPFKPMGALNSPPIQLGGTPPVGGVPSGYVPPPFNYSTTAQRLGRLLKAPPIELGGAVEGPKGTPFRFDTTPMRFGRILEAPIPNDELPSSYLTDLFPDQLPSATRVRPKTIEGKK